VENSFLTPTDIALKNNFLNIENADVNKVDVT